MPCYIVTGANKGIGKEIVRRFTERNFPETSGTHKVILACRNVESGEETAKELRATMRYSNIELSVLPLDISKGKSIDSFVASVKKLGVTVDVLVNNAGKMVMSEVNMDACTVVPSEANS
jgi:short-subunit dehydrogenase